MEPRALLKSTPFFGEVLDDREIALLADRAQPVAFDRGDTIIAEDAPGASMFVLAAGEVEVTVSDETDPVAKLGPGAVIGEMSLLTGAPRNATVTALGPVEALEVNKDALANVLWMAPTLVDRFVEMLFRRQRELDRAHGGAAWGMIRPGKAEIAHKIRNFFEEPADGATTEGAAASLPGADEAVRAAVEGMTPGGKTPDGG